MPAIITPKITDAGFAAAVNADANGLQLAITHVALGTGVYNSEAVGSGMTAMAARVEHVAVGRGQVSGTGAFRVLAHFSAYGGATYNATELGFWAGEPGQPGSVLFAVYSSTTETIVARNTLDYIGSFTMQLVRVPPGSITIEVDPSAAQALALIALHEQASDPHQQYVRADGTRPFTGAQAGLTAAQHDNTTKLATTQFVKRLGVSYPASGGVAVTGADITVALADLGRWFDMQFNGGVLRLPSAAACPPGGAIAVRVSSLTGTIAAASGDTLVTMRAGVVSAVQVAAGDWMVISRNGPTEWWVTQQGSQVPVGMVCYMPTLTPPPGFLPISGALLTRSGYAALLAFAQASGMVTEAQWMAGYFGRFSTGNGSTTFRMPDIRGLSLQGYDDGRGLDEPGRAWGYFQASANKSHTHGLTDPGHTHGVNDSGHSHGASSSTIGNHSHGAAIGQTADHSHSGTAQTAGGHVHNVVADVGPNPNAGTLTAANRIAHFGWYDDYGYALQGTDNPANRGLTSEAGSHAHNLSISAAGGHSHSMTLDPAGSHAHNISVGDALAGIALYGATTGIGMQAEGAGRARPDNINWPAFIRYC